MNPAEVAEAIQILAQVPVNVLVGSTRDRLVYISNEGGPFAMWSVDPESGSKLRVTAEPVVQLASPRHASNEVFYTKDMAKGAELHNLYRVDVVAGRESLVVEVPSMRIDGLAAREGIIAFTGATKEDIVICTSESGNLETRAKINNFAAVTDANRKYVVGFGSLANDPRSYELFILDLSTGRKQEYTRGPVPSTRCRCCVTPRCFSRAILPARACSTRMTSRHTSWSKHPSPFRTTRRRTRRSIHTLAGTTAAAAKSGSSGRETARRKRSSTARGFRRPPDTFRVLRC